MGSPFKTVIGGTSPFLQPEEKKINIPRRKDIPIPEESGVQGKTKLEQGPDINEKIVNAITNFIVPQNAGEAALGIGTLGLGKIPGVNKLISNMFKGDKATKTIIKGGVQDGAKTASTGVIKSGVGANPKNVGFNFAKGSKTAKPHFKQFSERTHAVRGGKVFDEGLAEYNSISSMHKLYPNRVVKPLNVVTDDAGKILGYNMEKVKGVTLYEKNKLSKKAYNDIAKTIKDMNSKGLYHGDLHARNIIIDKSGNWKLIDPVGYQHASHMNKNVLADAANRDIKSLQELKKYVE